MSWHFLLEGEVASWEGNSLAGAPSSLLKYLPTQEKFSLHVNATDVSLPSLSGTMSLRLTEDLGREQLMSSPEASPASMSAILGQEASDSESKENGVGSGFKWLESSEKLGQPTSSSRTLRKSDTEDSTLSFKTLPKWGMIVRGMFSPERKWEHRMTENASGVWLGTPTAHMHVRSKRFKAKTPNLSEAVGGRKNANPEYLEWQMGWPINWTDSRSSGMDRYLLWLQLHLSNYERD